jgi:hypothetical protein
VSRFITLETFGQTSIPRGAVRNSEDTFFATMIDSSDA